VDARSCDPRGTSTRWKDLWRHSYRLGLRWLVLQARNGWPAPKYGLARLLVPLDPWRYYELGKLAAQEFHGKCLDVAGPKLLPSLLQAQGRGTWTCIDLFRQEIAGWRVLDPNLDLEVQDATRLTFSDAAFDICASVSVLEHLKAPKDAQALAEIWRVLKPGGTVYLTTDLGAEPRDHYLTERIYGEASTREQTDLVFFRHEYTQTEITALLQALPWQVEQIEYAVQRSETIERWFYRLTPWSYLVGPLLRWVCPQNFETSDRDDIIHAAGRGILFARLRKPPGEVDTDLELIRRSGR